MRKLENISNEELEQFDDYLSGNMSAQDQATFQNRLDGDPALRSRFEEARLLFTGIGETALREKVAEFHQQAAPSKVVPIRSLRKRIIQISAAAAIVIAVAAIFIFRSPEHEKIYADFFEPDPGLSTAMGSTDDYAFNRGMIDYKTGKYEDALMQWRPLLLANPANDTLNYFSGVAFLAKEETDSAELYLRKVLAIDSSTFQEDARWYLALTLIRADRKQEAIPFLQQANHPGKEELLSRLK